MAKPKKGDKKSAKPRDLVPANNPKGGTKAKSNLLAKENQTTSAILNNLKG